MNRRGFVRATTAGMALALAGPAPISRAAPAASRWRGRLPRVGVLGESNPLAWVFHPPGVELVCRWAAESGRRLTDLATELVALDPDAIVAVGTRAARVAARLTGRIPIVFVVGGDPVAEGLVASLEAPGRNVTGLGLLSEVEIAARRLALLREIVPGLATLGVLRNPDNVLHAPALVATRGAAERQGIDVRVASARLADTASNEAQLREALGALEAAGVQGLIVLPDALFSLHADALVVMAEVSCLPAVYPARTFVALGGLTALSGDSARVVRRVVALVATVLDGASPATLPVQRLDALELTLNLRAAARQDLHLPAALRARASATIA
jgi:putative ABC transport system substrate-binding protein